MDLENINLTPNMANIIEAYTTFAIDDYISRNGKSEETEVMLPYLNIGDEISFVVFRIGSEVHKIPIPNNQYTMNKIQYFYYAISIPKLPRKNTKAIVNHLIESDINGSLCYQKRGEGALIYFELNNQLGDIQQIADLIVGNTVFKLQKMNKLPNLSEDVAKWVSLKNFILS